LIQTLNLQKTANVFNEHYSTIADKIAAEIPPSNRPPDEHCKPVNCTVSLSSIPITTKELLKTLLKNLKIKKVVIRMAYPLSYKKIYIVSNSCQYMFLIALCH
jgi:hypothetical protein